MRKCVSLLLALLLMFSCTACGTEEQLTALQAQVAELEAALAESETQRIRVAYDFQRELENMTSRGEQVPPPTNTAFICGRTAKR